jgi:hypothetical protein
VEGDGVQATNDGNYKTLSQLINNMTKRHQSALFVLTLVDDATKALASRKSFSTKRKRPDIPPNRLTISGVDEIILPHGDPVVSECTEAELLGLVAHIIDNGLANDINERVSDTKYLCSAPRPVYEALHMDTRL